MAATADANTRPRPGGRSARVRAAVLGAVAELLAEGGFDAVELPEVARRAHVHPTTVYRRWAGRGQLVGEAILESARTLSPTPNTGALATDLERLLLDGASLVRTPPVRALFQVLIAESAGTQPELVAARDRFWAAHQVEAHAVVARAVARGELGPDTDPSALIDLVVGPALLRLLLMGQDLGLDDASTIVARAIVALGGPRLVQGPASGSRRREAQRGRR
jgi:AcrR family transcriptional regulator